MKICKGLQDKNNGCKHVWKYILNSDKIDNTISEQYFTPVCINCGLMCRIKIPVDCYMQEKTCKYKVVKAEDFDNPRSKNCEECGYV